MPVLPKAVIKRNQSLCTTLQGSTCGACQAACRHGAMLVDFNSNYLWTECRGCGACLEACPVHALSWQEVPPASWEDRPTRYFAQAGVQNTLGVVEAVTDRLRAGDITAIACGSISGASALLLAEAERPQGMPLINVSFPPDAFARAHLASLPERAREALARHGVTLLEAKADWASLNPLTGHSSNVPKTFTLSDAATSLYEVLIDVGGMGMKVAVLAVLEACLQGVVPEGARVIGMGGTAVGLDCAAVVRATVPHAVFGPDPPRRLEIEEIVAKPTRAHRYC